jgi:hypothetical protein
MRAMDRPHHWHLKSGSWFVTKSLPQGFAPGYRRSKRLLPKGLLAVTTSSSNRRDVAELYFLAAFGLWVGLACAVAKGEAGGTSFLSAFGFFGSRLLRL